MMTESKKYPLVLVCNQRSGSTALHSALQHGGGVDAYGEIFHPEGNRTKCNFYKYLSEKNLSGSFPITTSTEAKSIADDFVKYCVESSDREYCLLDIKYNMWHVLQGPWLNLYEPPQLLASLNQQGAKYLHLIRKNLFLQYLSGVYAAKAKKWHYYNSEEDSAVSFVIDIPSCERNLEAISQNIELFERHLPRNKTLTFYYEDLFESDGAISKQVSDDLQVFLKQVWDGRPESKLKKTPMSAQSAIENKSEILEYFGNTKYGEMISDAFAS
jgi:LPS sulfotransferase NodH